MITAVQSESSETFLICLLFFLVVFSLNLVQGKQYGPFPASPEKSLKTYLHKSEYTGLVLFCVIIWYNSHSKFLQRSLVKLSIDNKEIQMWQFECTTMETGYSKLFYIVLLQCKGFPLLCKIQVFS